MRKKAFVDVKCALRVPIADRDGYNRAIVIAIPYVSEMYAYTAVFLLTC